MGGAHRVFGTPLLAYSSTFWDHSIQIALVAAATFWLVRGVAGSPRAFIIGGAIAGCGAWIQELVIAYGICVAVALAPQPRWAFRWLAGVAVPVAGWLVFNRIFYGAVRGPHLMGPLLPGGAIMRQQFCDLSILRDRAADEIAGAHGRLGWLYLTMLAALLILRRAGPRRLALGVVAVLTALSAWLLAKPGFAGGLFEVTPWLLFALVERPSSPGWSDTVHRVFGRCTVLFLLVVVATPIAPGLNWGSRYLLTISPMLALTALRSLERLGTANRPWLSRNWHGPLVACA